MLNSPFKLVTSGGEVSVGKAIARALVFALLTAFVWVGGSALFTAVARDTLKLRLDPDVSSDFILAVIGVSHPTNAVNEMLRPWDENKVLLVIAPASNPYSTQVYYELLILGYPRRMPAVMCDSRPGASPGEYFQELASSHIDGLIFFDIAPPRGITGIKQIAPKLYTARYQGVPAWNSFCP
jgi:hypothetical protein